MYPSKVGEGEEEEYKKFKNDYFYRESIINYVAQGFETFQTGEGYLFMFEKLLELYKIQNYCIYTGFKIKKDVIEGDYDINMIYYGGRKNIGALFDADKQLTQKYNRCTTHDSTSECNKSDIIFSFLWCPGHVIPMFINKKKNLFVISDSNLGNTCWGNDTDKLYNFLNEIFNKDILVDNKFDPDYFNLGEKINDYKLLNPNNFFKNKTLSIFQHRTKSGTCQTWAMYILLIFALNKNYPIRKLLKEITMYDNAKTHDLVPILYEIHKLINKDNYLNEAYMESLKHMKKSYVDPRDINLISIYIDTQYKYLLNHKSEKIITSNVENVKVLQYYIQLIISFDIITKKIKEILECLSHMKFNNLKKESFFMTIVNIFVTSAKQIIENVRELSKIYTNINEIYLIFIDIDNVVIFKGSSNIFSICINDILKLYKKNYNVANTKNDIITTGMLEILNNYENILKENNVIISNSDEEILKKYFSYVICLLKNYDFIFNEKNKIIDL